MAHSKQEPGGQAGAANTTIKLLERARNGDQGALDQVFTREIPRLARWARGRLPRWARSGLDTDDLVQETVVQTLKRIDVFGYRADGALQAYLRQAIMNRIRNEIRRGSRHPSDQMLESGIQGSELSPLEALIGKETVETYDTAMDRLEPSERDYPTLFVAVPRFRLQARLARDYRRLGRVEEAVEIENEVLRMLRYADADHRVVSQINGARSAMRAQQ